MMKWFKQLDLDKKLTLGVGVVAVAGLSYYTHTKSVDIVHNTVAITNNEGTSGGSGVVLTSKSNESLILTNAHVCRLVETRGGLVKATYRVFPVAATKISQEHDLCLLKVIGDLKGHTNVAEVAPLDYYENATIAGHPGLMPTAITQGHYSGSAIISILTSFKKCDDKERQEEPLFCNLFGGLPVIHSYDSQFVTATIMPGSSGSAVYNSSKELTGLVFAGRGELGYAWTVPYRALRQFLEFEAKTLTYKSVDSSTILTSTDKSVRINKTSEEEQLELIINFKANLRKLCAEGKVVEVKHWCFIIKQDTIWNKDNT